MGDVSLNKMTRQSRGQHSNCSQSYNADRLTRIVASRYICQGGLLTGETRRQLVMNPYLPHATVSLSTLRKKSLSTDTYEFTSTGLG